MILKKIQTFWKKTPKLLKNKYVITLIFFFVWLLVFDKNNLGERISGLREINRLEQEKTYYIEKISEDSAQLELLKTDKETIERYAREQYLMKKDDEDIFIVVEKDRK